MTRAMERHAADEAVVIPVILRPCDWHDAPFGRLMATPSDGRPVTQWPDRDQAFLEVAKAIRKAVEKLDGAKAGAATRPTRASPPTTATWSTSGVSRQTMAPRSSNLALAKRFTDRDKDAFLVEAFDYLAAFFENSVSELAARNPGVEGDFRRVDANRFFVSAYRDGKAVARGTVFLGGMLGQAINYVQGQVTESNGYNESLSVDADDQTLFLCAMGMGHGRRGEAEKLTFEGAAEYYWGMFVQPLQQR